MSSGVRPGQGRLRLGRSQSCELYFESLEGIGNLSRLTLSRKGYEKLTDREFLMSAP